MMPKDDALIAQIGRTIGLWGDLKFHLHTDFPEQFQVGKTFASNRGNLTIADINFDRGIIRFVGHESIESAKKLTNTKLFTDEAQTKANCNLKEGQHFWFDLVGCRVMQKDEVLGSVTEVQRMGDTDYLWINTQSQLVEEGLPKVFLIPYIERYIIKSDTVEKVIFTQDAKDILEAS